MKKRYINIIAVCMAAIVVAACGKEQIQQPVPDPEPGNEPEVVTEALDKLTVQAEVATKTVLDGNSVKWSVGDAISVFSTDHGVNHEFDSSLSEESLLTTFSGEVESGTTEVVAVYPYTDGAEYSRGTITGFSIPTQQTATESSFANGASVTFAKAKKTPGVETLTMTFQNLCSVLKFTVPEGIKQSSSIRVESINPDVKMSGAVKITDSATPAITSALESYVELTGNFTGGKTYCVTVAPGNYDQGFRFTLTGTNNTTLVREAPVVNASKGKVYNIGVLNPVVDGDDVSISGSIQHTYENSTLTGSTASVTIFYPQDEFANNIKGWKLKNVTMEKDGSVLYRRLPDGTAYTNGQPITLNQESDIPYMPQGSYTFSADIYYTVNKADGTPADKFLKTVTTTVASLPPDTSKFTLTASPTGYTSYSVYKGTDGQTASAANANNVKNDVIKGIGGQYTGGLSSQVYTQCSNLLSFTATYKNGDSYYSPDANGNSAEWLSWGEHKVKCTSVTFDGATQSCDSEKTVYITGLPYQMVHPANDPTVTHNHPWQVGSNGGHTAGVITWNDNGHLKMRYSMDGLLSQNPRIVSPLFDKLPGTIDVRATGDIRRNDSGIATGRSTKIILCYQTIYHDNNNIHEVTPVLGRNGQWTGPFDTTMDKDHYRWDIMNDYAQLGPEIYVYSFKVEYR